MIRDRSGESQCRSKRGGEGLPLPGIQPRFSGRSARSLAIILTKLQDDIFIIMS